LWGLRTLEETAYTALAFRVQSKSSAVETFAREKGIHEQILL
jgi:hypothetical protein